MWYNIENISPVLFKLNINCKTGVFYLYTSAAVLETPAHTCIYSLSQSGFHTIHKIKQIQVKSFSYCSHQKYDLSNLDHGLVVCAI